MSILRKHRNVMWVTIAQIICLAVSIVLFVIALDLDHQTPGWVRAALVGFCIGFFAVFLISSKHPEYYPYAASIAFAGFGVLVLTVVLYLVLTHQIQPIVVKISGVALGISLLVWTFGSCSDSNRQKLQIEQSATPAPIVTPGDTTQQAIEDFNKLTQ
ncbi:hypothetical protein [Spirosoma sp. KNUC1025]|uniref:hypothetical protein n=1 Tax=Spirosoma sp. KNUC1025 TaxID=2894082 RepID=UPI00386E02AA|nr:hypothetical protein LN737_19140 [Spirosoma sp. KNUC1025]